MNHSRGASHTYTEGRTSHVPREGIERKDRWCLIVPLSATRQTESALSHGYLLGALLPFFFFFFSPFEWNFFPLEGDSKLWILFEPSGRANQSRGSTTSVCGFCRTAHASRRLHEKSSSTHPASCARSNQNKLSKPWRILPSQQFHISCANWVAARDSGIGGKGWSV